MRPKTLMRLTPGKFSGQLTARFLAGHLESACPLRSLRSLAHSSSYSFDMEYADGSAWELPTISQNLPPPTGSLIHAKFGSYPDKFGQVWTTPSRSNY